MQEQTDGERTRWANVVYIVEDNAVLRGTLIRQIQSHGWEVRPFADVESFLKAWREPSPGVLLLDQQLPGLQGMDLVEHYYPHPVNIPIVLMSSFADLPLAVQAVRNGAIDVLKKPFDGDVLGQHVEQLLQAAQARWPEILEGYELKKQFESLTVREREVLDELAAGRSNKDVGCVLDISPKTVEVHRSHIMEKLHAESLTDVVRRLGKFGLLK